MSRKFKNKTPLDHFNNRNL